MRPYFTFYRSYYTEAKKLDNKSYLIFINALCEVHFKDGNTYKLAKEKSFCSKKLNKAWEVVIRQLAKRDRNCKEYIDWRNAVYAKDNYKCKICNSKRKLNAHHVVRWVDSIELRFELSNGITLCEKCHKQVHSGEIDL